jgi:hypothetical protein
MGFKEYTEICLMYQCLFIYLSLSLSLSQKKFPKVYLVLKTAQKILYSKYGKKNPEITY